MTRCKRTGNPLPAMWKHPELDGQLVAAFTRKNARLITLVITGKDLSEDGFSRTGYFAWRERIISTLEDGVRMMVKPEDMAKGDGLETPLPDTLNNYF